MNQFELNETYQLENFIARDGVSWAKAGALAVVENLGTLYNPFYLYGQSGVGKTHLLQGIGNEVLKKDPHLQVNYIFAKDFANECLEAASLGGLEQLRKCYSNLDLLILDDIQVLSEINSSIQEELITIFDLLYRQQKQIVISSTCEPDELENVNPQLIFRFKIGLTSEMWLNEK